MAQTITKGRSIGREKIPNDIFKQLTENRKNFFSSNAHRIAIGINSRTYKSVVTDKECRSDVLQKIELYLKSLNK